MPILNIARRSFSSPALVAVIFFFFCCGLIFPGNSHAAVQKSIHIEWSYDTSLPDLAGYRIYQDSQLVQVIGDPLQLSADLTTFFSSNTSSFTMTAFDNAGNESSPSVPYSITVDLSVISLKATIVADALSGYSPLSVHFDGSHSNGGQSTIVSWNWDFGDGDTASGTVVDHQFSVAGLYPVTLTVTDANGNTDVDQVTVTVTAVSNSGNLLPIADIVADHASGTIPFLVHFDAGSSADEDGSIMSYYWDFGDGTSQSGQIANHTYTASGLYNVTLTVTDDEGGHGQASVAISVAGTDGTVNALPVASIEVDSTMGVAPMTVSFDAGNSTDSDGTIALYEWNFGDGGTASGSFWQYEYTSPGTYTARLTVTDDKGAVATANVEITVQDPNDKTYSGGVTVNGSVIAGIQVVVLDSSQKIIGAYPVDNGTFATDPLPDDFYTFIAVYGNMQTEVFADQTTDWQLTLRSLSGTIDGINGDGTGSVIVIALSQKAKLMAGVKLPDLNGTAYTIKNLLPADDYIVSVTALDKPVLYYDGTVSSNNATPVDLTAIDGTAVDFDLSGGQVTPVSGKIIVDGAAMANVPVYAYEVNTSSLQMTFAGGDGSYNLSLVEGDFILFTVANGRTYYFTDSGVNQNLDQATIVKVSGGSAVSGLDFSVVSCGYGLFGTVTDGLSGQAITGAMVTAKGSRNVVASYTDGNGHYDISGICADTYSLYMDVRQKDYPIQQKNIEIIDGNATADFVVNTGHTLTGTVTSAVDSAPLAGTKLYLENVLTGELFGLRFFTTDQQGKFIIHDIPSGDYTLHVVNPGFEHKALSGLNINADLNENISLTAGGYVWGYVRDNLDTAIAGRLVQVQGSGMQPLYGKTDVDGRFTIAGLPLDTPLSVVVSRGENLGYQIASNTVYSSVDGTQVDITLTAINQAFTLSGNAAMGCDQSPLVNAQVVAYYEDANTKFFKVTWTDVNGNYTFSNLPAAAGYRLAVVPGSGQHAIVIEGIDGTASADVVQDVELSCGQSIAGIVSISNVTSPVYAVLFDSTHAYVDYIALQNTGQDGSYSFSFDNLPDGEYKLVLTASGEAPLWYANASSFEAATSLFPGGATLNLTFGQ